MAEDAKRAVEIDGADLDQVAGGVSLGEDGYVCTRCGSKNTFFNGFGYKGWLYYCNDCNNDFEIPL